MSPREKSSDKTDSQSSDSAEEGFDFRSAIGDVVPLANDKRVDLKTDTAPDEVLRQRRRAATEEVVLAQEGLSGDYVKLIDPHDVLEFKRPGIQHGVFKNLRMGKYQIEARLDLHRLSVEQARTSVAQFAKDCIENNVRCALITHGKGVDRQPQPALLKSCIAHWLPQLEEVLAFHSAQKQHGGVGSTYVLLRKSEKKRQENFEKHHKRQ